MFVSQYASIFLSDIRVLDIEHVQISFAEIEKLD
jgi:hypothetical protein